jgi:hypothetical protein
MSPAIPASDFRGALRRSSMISTSAGNSIRMEMEANTRPAPSDTAMGTRNLRLRALLCDDRQQAQRRGQRGDQDRAEAPAGGFGDRVHRTTCRVRSD